METIRIPSPSAILDPPPRTPVTKSPPSSKQQTRPGPTKPSSNNSVAASGINRPKQSKSRNGCITCKTKRLKCDETKPSCQQCHKRNVTCGGYKKDFKWRPFEETVLTSKSAPKAKKAASPPFSGLSQVRASNTSSASQATSPSQKKAARLSTPAVRLKGSPDKEALLSPISDSNVDNASLSSDSLYTPMTAIQSQSVDSNDSLLLDLHASDDLRPALPGLSGFTLSDADIEMVTGSLPFSLEQSVPALQFGSSSQPSFSSMLEDENQDVEDIIRESDPGLQLWPVQGSPSPAPMGDVSDAMMNMLFREPDFAPGSEEMLVRRFDQHTCGILSVKDGRSENPWRMLIWPMAKQTPALYHAVFAMAAFHSSKEYPALRFYGLEHMRKSITYMVQRMEQMRTDAALATTLSLAFAESWDQHTSTGIQHLKGAKALMRQTLSSRIHKGIPGEDLARLRFLYNTWLYMDVIARLTSLDEGDKEELAPAPFVTPAESTHEIDPLMGCATTLFPLIGHAANLIQRVRKTGSNSFAVISEAINLKTLVEQWDPPRVFDAPEDPTSDIVDGLQTAQAYRWATLLYLHQAVPEIPSESSYELAERVIKLLATVPLTSRTTIIHIFPLLAASCEVENEDDRSWILERWVAMQNRLMIGNIDRCIDVIREVWRRRDSFKIDKQQRQRRNSGRSGLYISLADTVDRKSSSGSSMGDNSNTFYSSDEPWSRVRGDDGSMLSMGLMSSHSRRGSIVTGVENIEFEQTVRGRLHWIGVMRDWSWEVLLG